MIKSFSIFYILCFFIGFAAEATYTITLHKGQNQYPVESEFVGQLEDKNASYTIGQISSDTLSNLFKASGKAMLRITDRNAAYWFKIINY